MTTVIYADDTAILAVGNNIEEITNKLQEAVNKIDNWTKQWRIKLNASKSIQVNFINRKIKHLPINLNKVKIPHANMAKYLGMNIDAKLMERTYQKENRRT